MFTKGAILAAIIVAIGAKAAGAQDAETVASYPWGASKTVTSDGSSSPPLVFSSAGSGAFVLDASTEADPRPWVGASPNALDAEGFVWDIKATGTHLYAAARRGGLVIFDRATWTKVSLFDLVAQARVLDIVSHSGKIFVFVGTVDEDGLGRIHLVDATLPASPVLRSTRAVNAPVYALAANVIPATSMARLLVGVACNGGPSSNAALLRYDVDLSVSFPTIPVSPTATWQDSTQPAFIRDITVDNSATSPIAFVASHVGKLHRFDISSGLTEVTAGWPIVQTMARFHEVELIKPFDLLVVAAGPNLREEEQYWGNCSKPTPCYLTSDEPEPLVIGLLLYDAVTGQLAAQLPEARLHGKPVGLAVRTNVPAVEFVVDVVCDVQGYQLVRGSVGSLPGGGSGWVLQHRGGWDKTETITQPTALSLGSLDDVAVVGSYLYMGNENGLGTSDLGATPVLSKLVDFDNGQGVLLVGRAGPDIPRIFSTSAGPGIAMWDIADGFGTSGVPSNPVKTGVIDTNAQPFGMYLIPPPPSDASRGALWLYGTNGVDDATNPSGDARNGGVHVYRVEPNAIAPDGVLELGSFAALNNTPLDAGHGFFIDSVAVTDPSSPLDSQIVWVSYGPVNLETDAGLMTLRAQQTLPDTVRFSFDEKDDIGYVQPQSMVPNVGRLTYDPARQILYGAFGCAGFAAFDVSDPDDPVLLKRIEIGEEVVLHVVLAPSNHIYVGFLDKGYIGTIDAATPASWTAGQIMFHPTRFQANFMTPAPTSGGETPLGRLFVADGRGGVHKVFFPQFGP